MSLSDFDYFMLMELLEILGGFFHLYIKKGLLNKYKSPTVVFKCQRPP